MPMTTADETPSTNQSNNANNVTNGSTTTPDEEPHPCGCPIGDGSYCGARAKSLAASQGCELDQSVVDDNTLYICEDGAWATLNDCDGECLYDEASTELDDVCEIPECDCFVQVAWCGTGAGKKAETLGCKIPILPEHNGDILHCPGGNWAVKEACDKGCIEAPEGTPDECRTESQYLLPFNCGMATRCSNGNHTSSHSGTDEYAYDFAVPVGTNVRAMRGGVVHRVRIVSKPGSACYNGGGSSCANYANTVEIRHNDGSIGLYMHIRTASVSVGDTVKQGDLIAKSGNTGWSTGPHLHVQVQSNCGSWWCPSRPFRFGEKSPIVAGTTTTSKNNCP
ncbi:MAG: M23 family metallopeptidase [bacterium]